MTWLGPLPPMRVERHFGSRLTRCFTDRPPSVAAMLAEAVALKPAGEALVCDGVRWTYGSLANEVGWLAGGLAGRGVTVGDRVALLIANSAEFVLALLAVQHLGAIAVPLNVREGPDELGHILRDCGASVLLHGEALALHLPPPSATPAIAHHLAIGDAHGPVPLSRLFASQAPPVHVPTEEDVAAILYTSGTTGRPKGAMLTHLGLVHAAMIYEACMGLEASDRSVATVPLSHVTGLTAGIMAMLRVAGTLIVMPAFKADAFLALAAAERMTHTVMVPAMYALCLMSPAMAQADLTAWRLGGYGGAPMPSATIHRLAERLPGLQLFNAYGATETTGPVVLMPPASSADRAGAVGCAVPVADVLVMDTAGCETPPGESGEIWLKAPNVIVGYWGNPTATAEHFIDGYWRSGDIGARDAEGFVTLLDRVKDLVNRGGYKVYSVEVENVLAAHPAVREAAVVGRPCPVLGERVHAFVTAEDGFRDGEALRRHAAEALADYKVPEAVHFLETPLPRNANGKVLKRDLRARLERDV